MQPASHVITPEQAGNSLYGLFVERTKRSATQIAYCFHQHNEWQNFTWQDMADQVGRWQTALTGLGLQRGDRVGIMLRNCPYWVMFDQAAMSLGLVVVPFYTMDRADNMAYIIQHANVRVLLLETEEQWNALIGVLPQLDDVICFISLNKITSFHPDSRLISMSEFLPAKGDLLPALKVANNELASLIYTSGTTGKPKGVMLTHGNMLSDAYACLKVCTVDEQDILLSFLPLSHTFERTVGYYASMMAGAKIAYARSIPLLSEDLQIIHPTMLVSVPRIYERIYSTVKAKVDEASPLKRKLFDLTIEVGWARFLHQQGRGSWQPSFLLWPILQQAVAQKVLERLGGQLKFAISGGAALPAHISKFFVGLGLNVVQGYGLTETSPVISVNHLNNNFPDSVGLPLEGVQVKLSKQNELLVRGPTVMLGYWQNPEATQAVLDENGWLNTGDVVRISDTGHIYITGRTKEIIVMSNGEKLPPADMEMAILQDDLFEQVMVYGEAKPYLVALAVLKRPQWVKLTQEIGIRADMPESLTDSRVLAAVLQRISDKMHDFPGYANVHCVHLSLAPWTIENGLLTPTLKLKRGEVAKHFSAAIQAMYEGH